MYKVNLSEPIRGELRHIDSLWEKLQEVKREGGTSLWMLGGHIPKVGCSKYISQLYRAGFITHVAISGACAIHDFELCMLGKTSEDIWVDDFGMKENSERIYRMMLDVQDLPLGISLRQKVRSADIGEGVQAKYWRNDSVIMNTPCTVHSFIQIDMPSVWAVGKEVRDYTLATWKDFERFTQIVANLKGGIVVNVGSAVQMPGIFLKATARAKRMGFTFDSNYSAYNLDMIQHYNANRLHPNKVTRITGYHETLLPLICEAVKYDL